MADLHFGKLLLIPSRERINGCSLHLVEDILILEIARPAPMFVHVFEAEVLCYSESDTFWQMKV